MRLIRRREPSEPDYDPPQKYRPQKPFWDMQASHWVGVVLTVALIGVGLSQLVVYWRQAGMMDTQISLTREIERPFIVPDGDVLTAARADDGKLKGYEFRVNWRNTGHSVTRNLVSYTIMRWDNRFGTPKRPVPEFADRDPVAGGDFCVREIDRENSVRMFLGPNQSMPGGAMGPVTVDKTIWAQYRLSMIYVAGIARYESRFPGDHVHVTQFCRFADSITGDPLSGRISIEWLLCRKHNCADDECDDKCP